jgi:hypothetical protein
LIVGWLHCPALRRPQHPVTAYEELVPLHQRFLANLLFAKKGWMKTHALAGNNSAIMND